MKALILGVTGQDGSYLAEVLLEKGYEVHGMYRKSATGNTRNIEHLLDKITLHRGDLLDTTSLFRIIKLVQPDEIYNEADQDHVAWSFDLTEYQYQVTGGSVAKLLEIIRQLNPKIKFFQPVTAHMFGKATEFPQNENTPFRPQSPYACAKSYAYTMCRFYRETYGMFVTTAIFYNHESPRRPDEYLSRKVTKAAARISLGLQDSLELGDLSAKIDWGYSKEYMEAVWNIMQLPNPENFVISTGETHSVQEFVDETFRQVNLDPTKYVKINPKFLRPASNTVLVGDITKARNAFGFNPQIKFKELIKLMLENDLKEAKRELEIKKIN